MKELQTGWKVAGLLLGLLVFPLRAGEVMAEAGGSILFNGHSHNDYLRKGPLFEALENRFWSVEADVLAKNGQLVVAHHALFASDERTLEKLYFAPLSALVKRNEGRVYRGGPLEFELMIDLKSGGQKTLRLLQESVARYPALFSRFENGEYHAGPVKLILSGSGSRYQVVNFEPRYFFIDGRFPVDAMPHDHRVIGRVSAPYRQFFSWRGLGEMPAEERKTLDELVASAHAQKLKVRFWGMPANDKVWGTFLDAGVDWINVDRPARFREFYEKKSAEK